MKELLVATTNAGKLSEYKAIFRELAPALKTVSPQDLQITQKIRETGRSFEENAVQKARFYHGLCGLATLSDDAGLEIDYLRGEPGVKSRRWPGYEASDEELMQMALDKLEGVPQEKRTARLRAVVALVFPGDVKNYIFEGVLKGSIAESPMPAETIRGYPFRSIFIPERASGYLGEMSIVAHRRQAVEKALPAIKKYLC